MCCRIGKGLIREAKLKVKDPACSIDIDVVYVVGHLACCATCGFEEIGRLFPMIQGNPEAGQEVLALLVKEIEDLGAALL